MPFSIFVLHNQGFNLLGKSCVFFPFLFFLCGEGVGDFVKIIIQM